MAWTKLRKVVAGAIRERRKKSKRSPEWRWVRKAHVKQHPACAACGGRLLLQVHHVQPFQYEPHMELEPSNLITLCGFNLCHLEIGHSGDYHAYNPLVRQHAEMVLLDPTRRKEIEAAALAARSYTDYSP